MQDCPDLAMLTCFLDPVPTHELLKKLLKGSFMASIIGVIKGDARSLDYSSHVQTS